MPTTKTPIDPPLLPYRCACGFIGTFDQVVDHVGKLNRQAPGVHMVMIREHYSRAKP
jgi:hypothetical protein